MYKYVPYIVFDKNVYFTCLYIIHMYKVCTYTCTRIYTRPAASLALYVHTLESGSGPCNVST